MFKRTKMTQGQCFVGGIAFGIGLVFIINCGKSPMPEIDITSWAGDSYTATIIRGQDKEFIACNDPRFNAYICMTGVDIKKIYDTLQRCKSW